MVSEVYSTTRLTNIDLNAIIQMNGLSRPGTITHKYNIFVYRGSQGANITYAIAHCVVRIIVQRISIGSWAWAISRHSHAR